MRYESKLRPEDKRVMDGENIFTPENSLGENLWFYINTNEMSEYSDLNLIDNVFVDLIKIDPNNKVSIINSSIPKITNNFFWFKSTSRV